MHSQRREDQVLVEQGASRKAGRPLLAHDRHANDTHMHNNCNSWRCSFWSRGTRRSEWSKVLKRSYGSEPIGLRPRPEDSLIGAVRHQAEAHFAVVESGQEQAWRLTSGEADVTSRLQYPWSECHNIASSLRLMRKLGLRSVPMPQTVNVDKHGREKVPGGMCLGPTRRLGSAE